MEARPSLRRVAVRDCFAALAMTALRNDKGCFAVLAMTVDCFATLAMTVDCFATLAMTAKPLAEKCEQIVFAYGLEQYLVKAR